MYQRPVNVHIYIKLFQNIEADPGRFIALYWVKDISPDVFDLYSLASCLNVLEYFFSNCGRVSVFTRRCFGGAFVPVDKIKSPSMPASPYPDIADEFLYPQD